MAGSGAQSSPEYRTNISLHQGIKQILAVFQSGTDHDPFMYTLECVRNLRVCLPVTVKPIVNQVAIDHV